MQSRRAREGKRLFVGIVEPELSDPAYEFRPAPGSSGRQGCIWGGLSALLSVLSPSKPLIGLTDGGPLKTSSGRGR
jgi:hypothetical protein